MKLSPVTLRILARPAILGDTVDQAAMSSLGGKCQFNILVSFKPLGTYHTCLEICEVIEHIS